MYAAFNCTATVIIANSFATTKDKVQYCTYQDGDCLLHREATESLFIPHDQELPHFNAGLQLSALITRLHVSEQLVGPRGCG